MTPQVFPQRVCPRESLKHELLGSVNLADPAISELLMKRIYLVLTLFAVASVLTCAAEEEGFRPLFNGTNTHGWHLRNAGGQNSWVVEQGILKNLVKKGEHGTDLVTDEKFKNFTVKYEYLVPDNSNSGFYLRGRHEIQILGDFAKGATTAGGNGGIYSVKAPDKFVSKPGTEWQTAEATIIGNKITVILNGVKIHDNVECNKPTGGELDGQVDQPGPIMLQGDHGTVWFRNLRIKELK